MTRGTSFGKCRTRTGTSWARYEWVCATGRCTRKENECGFRTRCDETDRMGYRCPQGYCVRFERECLRPCGFAMRTEVHNPWMRYNTKCPELELCLLDGSGYKCPKNCGKRNLSYCGSQLCVEKGHCSVCRELRCPDSRRCYDQTDICDGRNRCPGGFDEFNCTSSTNITDDDGNTLVPNLLLGMFVVALIAFAVYIATGLKNRRGRPVRRRNPDRNATRVLDSTDEVNPYSGITRYELETRFAAPPYSSVVPGRNRLDEGAASAPRDYIEGPEAPPSYEEAIRLTQQNERTNFASNPLDAT